MGQEFEDVLRRLQSAILPSPTLSSASAVTSNTTDRSPICFKLEATDLFMEVGKSIGQPSWLCTMPALRLHNELNALDDVWRHTLDAVSAHGANDRPRQLRNEQSPASLIPPTRKHVYSAEINSYYAEIHRLERA